MTETSSSTSKTRLFDHNRGFTFCWTPLKSTQSSKNHEELQEFGLPQQSQVLGDELTTLVLSPRSQDVERYRSITSEGKVLLVEMRGRCGELRADGSLSKAQSCPKMLGGKFSGPG